MFVTHIRQHCFVLRAAIAFPVVKCEFASNMLWIRGGGAGDVHVELHSVSILALDGGEFSTSRSCCFTPRTGPRYRHRNWKDGYCLWSILISIKYLRPDVCGLNKIMVGNLNFYVAWNSSVNAEVSYQ
jgi:hypothetical protein